MNAPRLLDLRESTNHPLSLRYSEVFDAAVVDGKFAHGRSQPGLDTSCATPFVIAARRAVAYGIEKAGAGRVIEDCLAEYYRQVQPRNASQWLDLDPPESPRLVAEPPWAAVFPWRARTIESYRQAYEGAALAENRAIGYDIGIEFGWLFCGPVREEKVAIEAARILGVLRSIARDGYRRSDGDDGDVRATALVNEALEWRWLITAGNHRAAAAAALEIESIPIRVNLVISRADAPYWKHVREGLFTHDAAQRVFDNLFAARPIRTLALWQPAERLDPGA